MFETLREMTQRALLRAGLSCFGRYGYERTRVVDIARTAGVALATFYAYFEGKEELFSVLDSEVQRDFDWHLQRSTVSDVSATARHRFHLLWAALLACAAQTPDVTRFLLMERPAVLDLDDRQRSPVPGGLVDCLKVLSESQQLGEMPIHVMAILVWGAFCSFFAVVETRRAPLTDESARLLEEMCWAALARCLAP